MKPIIKVYIAIFISHITIAQPGDRTEIHSYIFLTPEGDTMKISRDKGIRVDFDKTDLRNFSSSIEENVIYISYSSMGIREVNFSIYDGNEKMEIRTNIKCLSIPFIPGSFEISSLFEPYLLSHLNIENINWDVFSTDSNYQKTELRQLPMRTIKNTSLNIGEFRRVNDKLIVGLGYKSNNPRHYIFRSKDNGKSWQESIVTFPKKNRSSQFFFKDLIIQNDSLFYITGYNNPGVFPYKTKVIYSTDSGQTWKDDSTLSDNSNTVNSLFFLNDQTGVAVIEKYYQRKHLYIKQPGLDFWIDKGRLADSLHGLIGYDSQNRIYIVHYNPMGYRDSIIFRSSDYGLSWEKINLTDTCSFDPSAETLKLLNPRPYESGIQFKNDSLFYQYGKHNHSSFRSLNVENSNYDIILGDHHIYLSRNAGVSWKYVPLFNPASPISNGISSEMPKDLIIIDDSKVLLVYKNSLKIAYIDEL